MEGNAMKDNEGTMEEQKGINMKAGNADVEKKQKITEIVNKTEEELLSQLMKKIEQGAYNDFLRVVDEKNRRKQSGSGH